MDPAGKICKKTTNYACPDSTFPVCFVYMGLASTPYYVTEVGDTEDLVEIGFVNGKSYTAPNGFTFCVVAKYQDGGVIKKTFVEMKCKKKSSDPNKVKLTARCVNGYEHLYTCVHTTGKADGRCLTAAVRKLKVKLVKTWNKSDMAAIYERRLSVFSRGMMNHENFHDMLRVAKAKGDEDVCWVQVEWEENSGYAPTFPTDRVYRDLMQTRKRRVPTQEFPKPVKTLRVA